jgi:hypothetical protein
MDDNEQQLIGYVSATTLKSLQDSPEGHGFIVGCAGYDTIIPVYTSQYLQKDKFSTDDKIMKIIYCYIAASIIGLVLYLAWPVDKPMTENKPCSICGGSGMF